MEEKEMEEGQGQVEILEYQNSPKLTSFRAVSAANSLATSNEAGESPTDDITKEVESVTVGDEGSDTTSDDIEDSQ